MERESQLWRTSSLPTQNQKLYLLSPQAFSWALHEQTP